MFDSTSPYPPQGGFDDKQNLYSRELPVRPRNLVFLLMNMIFMGMNRVLSAGTGWF